MWTHKPSEVQVQGADIDLIYSLHHIPTCKYAEQELSIDTALCMRVCDLYS